MDWLKRRREAKEIKRKIEYRKGMTRISNYLNKLREMQDRYWELGKKALRLNDRKQFEHIAKTYLWAMKQSNRWERYMLQLETLGAKREMVRSTTDFIGAIQALSKSMLAGASPQAVAKIHADLEQALARGEALDEALATVMEISSETLFSSDELSSGELKDLEAAMAAESQDEDKDKLDATIDERIRKLEEAMRKEMS